MMTGNQLHNYRETTNKYKSSYPAFICKKCGNKCGLLGSRMINGKKWCKACVAELKGGV